MPDRTDNYYVPKKLIGELTRVLITSTDPAHILEFTPSLISACRALMMSMLEDNQPAPSLIASALESILAQMIVTYNLKDGFTQEEKDTFNKMLTDIFKSDGNARWGLALYRDILLCEGMYSNWEDANSEYIKDHKSWTTSNAVLVQINKVLFEIMIRHKLIQMPYDSGFNLDKHGTTTESVQQLLDKMIKEDDKHG
jgi:hypothetical protein